MYSINHILEALPNRVQATAVKNTLVANQRQAEGMDNVQEEPEPILPDVHKELEGKWEWVLWGIIGLLFLLIVFQR